MRKARCVEDQYETPESRTLRHDAPRPCRDVHPGGHIAARLLPKVRRAVGEGDGADGAYQQARGCPCAEQHTDKDR